LIFIAGVGWVEVLFLKPFVAWWLMRWRSLNPARQAGASGNSRLFWLPGVMLVAVLGALLPSAHSLAMVHRALFQDLAVGMFARGNFNGLELDLERHSLYAAGYGTNHLLAYDLVTLYRPPRQSPVESDYAQGFGYNPAAQELYVYNQQQRHSFFQENSDLIIYDTIRQQVVLRTPTPAHLDRLAFARIEGELELLAPAAIGAEILRFNPETLEQKGAIPSLFGARAIAVDPVRRLVLVGSLVTHQLEVIDLDSQQRSAIYYIGPWLRSLSLDVEAGKAYLSSHEGLFQIQYAEETEVSDHRGF
jgi:hypothetical protein